MPVVIFALAALESDAVLIEDVLRDAREAWSETMKHPLAPSDLRRLGDAVTRLDKDADELNELRIGMRSVLAMAQREHG